MREVAVVHRGYRISEAGFYIIRQTSDDTFDYLYNKILF